MVISSRSSISKRSEDGTKIIGSVFIGIVFGFFVGTSFPTFSITKVGLTTSLLPSANLSNLKERSSSVSTPTNHKALSSSMTNNDSLSSLSKSQIWIPSNPRGAERLPPGIIAAESDFYLHRLWGIPQEDLPKKSRYLVTFTVGYAQRNNIDACIKKFSDNFTVLLFHYDGRTSEWEEFEWSKRAIHISVRKQAKWWYAKRFLHPDIVAAYDYIFIWDEDLDLQHFNGEEYIRLVKKHGLEISQPALDPNKGLTWPMTMRREELDVHKMAEEKPGWCSGLDPPCAAFVEIMAPVFSRQAWRCVWHMIQNDLVHGWGLDFQLRRCVEEPAHERIGVVDSQYIIHQTIPSLGRQGEAADGKEPWRGVRRRCEIEWDMFKSRMKNADTDYFESHH